MERARAGLGVWPAAVRPGERDRFLFLLGLAALLHLAQTVGFVGVEALFLVRLGADALPATFVVASGATVLASLVYAGRVGRRRNDRVFVELLALAALAVLTVGIFAPRHDAALPALFCLLFAAQAVLLSHYWTFAGDLFDALAAKRVVPLFTVGMSLGGALGGGLAVLAMRGVAPETLVFAWGGVLALGAGFVRAARPRLRRWGALEVAEEDETSMAGIQSALRHLQRSRLGRWLVVSSLTMVLSLFVAQYLYSEVFVRAFPDETRLAAFLGLFLAVTNLGEVVVELWLVPLLIRRTGVAGANLAHPASTGLAFAALAVDFGVPAAVALRVTREPLENSLAAPIRNLVYNALPRRLSGRVRAFLEGIVVYAGMSVAGVLLLALGSLPAAALCATGGALALAYLGANWSVRRAYLDALVSQLRTGALELHEIGPDVGAREVRALAELWRQLLGEAPRHAGVLLQDLAELLAAHGFHDELRRGLDHASAAVRRISLRAWSQAGTTQSVERWLERLADPAEEVRVEALRALPEDVLEDPRVRGRCREALRDPSVAVRVEAAVRLGPEGESLLARLARSEHASTSARALEGLPPALRDVALERCGAPEPTVRAAALRALARMGGPGPPAVEEIVAHLSDADARVRRAASSLLAQRGRAAVAGLRAVLDSGPEGGCHAALAVLGQIGGSEATGILEHEYARQVRAAGSARLALRTLPDAAQGRELFLREALSDAAARALRLAFAALSQLEDPRVVARVGRTLRFVERRFRTDALEVLSNLGPREISARLVLLLEPTPLEEKLADLGSFVAVPRTRAEALEAAASSPSRWVRLAARSLAADPSALDPQEENLMERLLFLRRVPLFAELSLEQLEAIDRLTHPAEYAAKEVIVREGTPGEELFLIEQGEVEVVRGHGSPRALVLNRLGPGSYFGEMAVLDGAQRSATVVAATDTRLRVLDGERFRELIQERPEMSFEIFRVLTGRLRSAESRMLGPLDDPGGVENP